MLHFSRQYQPSVFIEVPVCLFCGNLHLFCHRTVGGTMLKLLLLLILFVTSDSSDTDSRATAPNYVPPHNLRKQTQTKRSAAAAGSISNDSDAEAGPSNIPPPHRRSARVAKASLTPHPGPIPPGSSRRPPPTQQRRNAAPAKAKQLPQPGPIQPVPITILPQIETQSLL